MNDFDRMSSENSAPRILVVRLSSLGDIILTSPVYRNIKAKWPKAEINVLVKPQFAAALTGNPHVDRVIPFKGIFSTLNFIRRNNITHFLDLHATLRTFIISTLAAIPYKSRYDKDSLERRMYVKFGIPSPQLQRHVLDRYLDALTPWDIPIKYRDLQLTDWNYYKKENTERPKSTARICIYQTAFLGDAVLTSPLIKKTAELFPYAEITLATRPETVDVFRRVKEVAHIITDDKRRSGLIGGILKMAGQLRDRRFDIILVPHRSFRSALIAWLSGIPVRVGFENSAGKGFFNRLVPFTWLLHDTERNLSLLNAITPTDLTPAPVTFEDNQQIRADLNSRLERLGAFPDRPLIGIHPGSAWFTKRWPPERFAMVIRLLYKTMRVRAIILGGKSDYELGEQICRLSRTDAINWTGKTSLPELMALMPKFRLFITNDSGPMHIATAFKVPTLGIFGPTTKELGFFPYGEGHRVIQKTLDCRPCALHGGNYCPRGHFLCMRLITATEVFLSSYEMLAGRKFNSASSITERTATAAAGAPATAPVRQPAAKPQVLESDRKSVTIRYTPTPDHKPEQKADAKAGPKYFDGTNDAPTPRPAIADDVKASVRIVNVIKSNAVIVGDGAASKPAQAKPAPEQKPEAAAQKPEAIKPAPEKKPEPVKPPADDALSLWEKSLRQPIVSSAEQTPEPEQPAFADPFADMAQFQAAAPNAAAPQAKPATPPPTAPAPAPTAPKKPAPVPQIVIWQSPGAKTPAPAPAPIPEPMPAQEFAQEYAQEYVQEPKPAAKKPATPPEIVVWQAPAAAQPQPEPETAQNFQDALDDLQMSRRVTAQDAMRQMATDSLRQARPEPQSEQNFQDALDDLQMSRRSTPAQPAVPFSKVVVADDKTPVLGVQSEASVDTDFGPEDKTVLPSASTPALKVSWDSPEQEQAVRSKASKLELPKHIEAEDTGAAEYTSPVPELVAWQEVDEVAGMESDAPAPEPVYAESEKPSGGLFGLFRKKRQPETSVPVGAGIVASRRKPTEDEEKENAFFDGL